MDHPILTKSAFDKAHRDRANAKIERSKENALKLIARKLEKGITTIGIGISPDPEVVKFVKKTMKEAGWNVKIENSTKTIVKESDDGETGSTYQVRSVVVRLS